MRLSWGWATSATGGGGVRLSATGAGADLALNCPMPNPPADRAGAVRDCPPRASAALALRYSASLFMGAEDMWSRGF